MPMFGRYGRLGQISVKDHVISPSDCAPPRLFDKRDDGSYWPTVLGDNQCVASSHHNIEELQTLVTELSRRNCPLWSTQATLLSKMYRKFQRFCVLASRGHQTLLLTEASKRKRASLWLVQGADALTEQHNRGGVEPLEVDEAASKTLRTDRQLPSRRTIFPMSTRRPQHEFVQSRIHRRRGR